MNYRTTLLKLFAFSICCVFVVLQAQQGVQAAGTVTNATEASLRAAMIGGGAVTFGFDGTITITNSLVIASNTTLDGNGHNVILNGGDSVRVFYVEASVQFILQSVTVANGRAEQGAGLYNSQGIVRLINSAFVWNRASGTNGVLDSDSFAASSGSAALGGAVWNSGLLIIEGTRFATNFAIGGRGGDVPSGPSYTSGDGGIASGGAVYSIGSLFLTNCSFIQNSTSGGNGGGGYIGGSGGAANGGAIYNFGGSLSGSNCVFHLNAASSGVDGGYRRGYRGNAFGGAIFNGGLFSLKASAVTSNSTVGAFAYGGGIYHNAGNATLQSVEFVGNLVSASRTTSYYPGKGGTGYGGGFCNLAVSIISESIFNANNANGGGGGGGYLNFGAPGGDGLGGAIFNSGGSIEIFRSTFFTNTASGGEGAYGDPVWGGSPGSGGDGKGGSIFSSTGSVYVVNSTLFSNRAIGGQGSIPPAFPPGSGGAGGVGSGGALFATNSLLALTNCSLAANGALGGEGGYSTFGSGPMGVAFGGGIFSDSNAVRLVNSIVANSISASNCFGVVFDGGHNISSDNSCNFTNTGSLNNTNPKLGTFGDHGGPTPTLSLLPRSAAIDAADDLISPATDQRGVSRPQFAHSDVGSFEAQTVDLPPIATITAMSPTNISFLVYGAPNASIRLQSSSGFFNWDTIATNIADTTGLANFTTSVEGNVRFYRAATP